MSLPTGVEYRSIGGERRLATRGQPISDEPTQGDWRAWDMRSSKLGAMLDSGLDVGLQGDDTVLYLGAGAGTTVSHVADFAGPVYAVEFAARPMRDLVTVCEGRPNLIPLLKDARQPATYSHVVESGIDVIVQDVATRGQARVAQENRRFLGPDGRLVLAIKARSEDVAAPPEEVFEAVLDELRADFVIETTERLDRYHVDHLGVVATLQ